jgi:hypothetical protein
MSSAQNKCETGRFRVFPVELTVNLTIFLTIRLVRKNKEVIKVGLGFVTTTATDRAPSSEQIFPGNPNSAACIAIRGNP